MKKLFNILAIMAVVIGCTERQHPLLRQAWELIEDRPDSARVILEKVRENALTKSGQAEYGLLKTIVDYKTFGTIKNDSLISASIDYYDQHGDDWHRGRSYLYRGAVRLFRYNDHRDNVNDTIVVDVNDTLVIGKIESAEIRDAIKDFKVAEAIAEDTGDEELKKRVYELLAYTNVYINGNDYPRILKYSHKLLDSSVKLNDSVMILRSLFMCATAHNYMGQTDSAYAYVTKALSLAKHSGSWLSAYQKHAMDAEIYLEMGDVRHAEMYLKRWVEIKSYYTRAQSLKSRRQYTEAVKQAKLCLKYGSNRDRLKCLELLSEIYELTGDKEQAAAARKQIEEYNSMIDWDHLETGIVDWQQQFDEERKTKDFYRRTSWMQGLIIALIVVVALAIGVGMLLHRRKVRRLSFRLDEDASRISELRMNIEQLEKSGEQNGQEMARLKEELENRMERISGTLLIGTQMFSQLQQHQCIAEATAKEQQCLVDYFAQLRPKRWQEWERKYSGLSTAQYIFLIMQDDLHFDDETIAAALNVKRTSVRSMRSRIKGRER